jgi:uncharacterized protein (DUF2267 family)
VHVHALDETALNRRMAAATGITDAEAIRRIGRAVTSVLLEELPAVDAGWLAALLPLEWVGYTRRAAAPAQDKLEDFYDRVAVREGIDLGFAREHAQSCCRALAEGFEEDARHRLTNRLPDELARLFDLSAEEHERRGAWIHRARRERSTLSEGRPASHTPISEATPHDAQQDSVTRSDNPHGDTKLSSSPGTTQERERETLARGRPKPR